MRLPFHLITWFGGASDTERPLESIVYFVLNETAPQHLTHCFT
jgi:hypothetical protein